MNVIAFSCATNTTTRCVDSDRCFCARVCVCFFFSTSLCHFAMHAIWLAQAKLSFRIVLRQLRSLCCIVFLLRVWRTQKTQKRKRPRPRRRLRRRQMKNIGRAGPQSSLSYIRLELSYTRASRVATNVCAQYSPSLLSNVIFCFVSSRFCYAIFGGCTRSNFYEHYYYLLFHFECVVCFVSASHCTPHTVHFC